MSQTPQDRIDTLIDAFESEWRSERRPDVATFLERIAETERPALLRELVRLELEYRLRAGEPARVEECLSRFPALQAERAEVLELIALEFRVRSDHAERVTVAEYLERFPALRDTLPAVLGPLRRGPAEVPGYEILEELGRGGMGVVYKARHLRLNRLVALKMILAGGHAGQPERDRLRAEAEAIARLHHVGVVQVYEAGECDGLPFVALELCPGGSLDRLLAAGPLPPRDAARLVEGVARGVQAAHEAQVVHRDLKPANVLIGADGSPKVTDFGLAKCLDGAGQTGSGALLGTPSYMAPEQAEGRGKQAGPAADVYALGAILYECLTGRPPFRAATAMDTLRQVIADEPVALKRLNAAVPRDLETICLKCLQKTPSRRYDSASELGDDLNRFLDNRPILARPVGPLTHGWRWCQRQPVLALSLVSSAVILLAASLVSTLFGVQAQSARAKAETSADIATQEADRASDALERALKLHEQQIGMVERDMITHGKLDARSERMLRDAVESFRGLIDRNSDRPEVRHRNGLAHLRLGELHDLLHEWQEGISQLRTAIGLFEVLVAEHPDNLTYKASLAESLSSAGYQVFYEREPDLDANKKEANELCERAVALWEQVTRIDQRTEYLAQRAAANYRLAVIARDQKDNARARAAFEVARRWQTETLRQEPQKSKHRSELARVCGSMSHYLATTGDTDGARECATAVVTTLQGMVGNEDANPRDEEEWYLAHRFLIDVAKALKKQNHVMELVRAVLPVMERRAKLNPQNELFARQLSDIQMDVLHAQKAPADVVAWATKAIVTLTPLYRASKQPRADIWGRLLDCYSRRAQALAELKRIDEALRDHDEGIALIKVWPVGDKHRQADFLRERHRDRVRWQRTLGRFREAALDADAASRLAAPAESWRDRLDAAEARALDGDVVAAYGSAVAVEKDPNLEVVHALDQLARIYDRHSERFGQDALVRKRNDERIVKLLTLALGKTGENDAGARMHLHERRALRHAGAGHWDEAGDDWEAVLKVANPKQDARVSEYREKAALMRTNAGKPAEAMKLLAPLGQNVPERQLYRLALTWARIAGHDKLPLPARDEAARHSLALLESMLQRKVPLAKAQLDFIDSEALWLPVRNLEAYKKWRDAVTAPADPAAAPKPADVPRKAARADRAMELLRKAVDAGFRDEERLRSKDLASLQNRDDFKKLIGSLRK